MVEAVNEQSGSRGCRDPGPGRRKAGGRKDGAIRIERIGGGLDMRRIARTVALLALTSSLVAIGGTTALAGPRAAVRTFSGTGSLGRYYTVQTVTGTFLTNKTVPTDVTVLNWQGTVMVTSAAPRLHNELSGGYWKQTFADEFIAQAETRAEKLGSSLGVMAAVFYFMPFVITVLTVVRSRVSFDPFAR